MRISKSVIACLVLVIASCTSTSTVGLSETCQIRLDGFKSFKLSDGRINHVDDRNGFLTSGPSVMFDGFEAGFDGRPGNVLQERWVGGDLRASVYRRKATQTLPETRLILVIGPTDSFAFAGPPHVYDLLAAQLARCGLKERREMSGTAGKRDGPKP